MGCASTRNLTPEEKQRQKEEKIVSKWISEGLMKEMESDREVIKLLFLGAGESGKSTFLKQMVIIHGEGFDENDRRMFIPLIYQNIMTSIKTLVIQARTRGLPLIESNEKYATMIEETQYDDNLSLPLQQGILQLWNDPAIHRTYDARHEFYLLDSARYFFERLPAISSRGYIPNNQDVLRARIRTTGIVEHTFMIENNEFRMFDVGGQRNARKKWIHCFENVTAVMFIAALSGYNSALYEDPTVNRLHESLNLFQDISDSHWFRTTPIILFLNKKDIFKEDIQKCPLTNCFPEYDGEPNYHCGCKFIKEQFKKRNRTEKRIYTHFTCATDTDNIEKVFQTVKSIVLRQHLMEIGLYNSLHQGGKR